MQSKIKAFRNANIIHFIINSIIGTSHILIYLYLFWITKQASDIYYYMIIIIFSFGIIPIFFAIFITFKNTTKNLMNNLKILLKYFIFLEILFSIISSICLSENERELSIFFLTCPFNYEIIDIDKIFEKKDSENINDIKEKCKNRRCFLNVYSNDSEENYLCNFNYKSKKKYCSYFSINNENISTMLMNYIDYCEDFVTFYKCQKPDKDYKKKINNYDYVCPDKSDEILNIILLYFFLIVDIVFLCTPWLIDISHIDEIIFLINDGPNNNVNNQNQNSQSLSETNNTSQEESEIEDDNNGNNLQRQPTKIIIVDKKEDNINNIANYYNKNDILNINQQNINPNNTKEKNPNSGEIESDKSKSGIQLINNQNNNVFKIFNKDIIHKDGK